MDSGDDNHSEKGGFIVKVYGTLVILLISTIYLCFWQRTAEKVLGQGKGGPESFFDGKPKATLEDLEKEYLKQVLNSTGWQKKKASSILGINASTLYRKIQRYNLEQEEPEKVGAP